MLYLVGETIDKHRANYGVGRGRLAHIMRGILVDAGEDADSVVLGHAVRIARYLYPRTWLAGTSAERLAPTLDGRLFLCGRRRQRTRLRSLEIVQTRAPDRPEIEPVTVTDSLGDVTVHRATARFRFLESFSGGNAAGAAMDDDTKRRLAERLAAEAGGTAQLVTALWRLAEANGWRTEAGRAERFLTASRHVVVSATPDWVVRWHGEPMGTLRHDGTGWLWRPSEEARPNPVQGGAPGALPPLLASLLPEGWLDNILNAKNERDRLTKSRRYMSNITIAPVADRYRDPPADVLQGRLKDWSRNGRFTGAYNGPAPTFDENLEQRMAAMAAHTTTPRMSGVQIKAPMTLTVEGELHDATESPFTHILKPSPGAGFETLPVIEDACLTAAEACGFDVPAHALVDMPEGLPDALLVERFDIRVNQADTRRLALEDMTSVRGLPATEKYQGSVEQVARGLRQVSNNWPADGRTLLLRALFAWLIADGDMHLKNLAILRVAPSGARGFTSVCLAPVYDAVTTAIFPWIDADQMALALNGKRNRLERTDFFRSGATMGLPATDVSGAIAELRRALTMHLERQDATKPPVNRACSIWRERLAAL